MNHQPQYLPILFEGGMIDCASELVWAVMHLPNDLYSALEFRISAKFTAEKIERSGKAKPTEGFRSYLRLFDERTGKASIAGLVAGNAVALHRHGYDVSLGRAIHVTSEEALSFSEPSRKRGSFPSHPDAIKKAWREFRDVGHFWMALSMMGPERQSLLSPDCELVEFLELSEFCLYELQRALPLLKSMKPWRPPVELVRGLNGLVQFRERDDVFHQAARSYTLVR